jgi:L-asparaginase II
MADPVLIELTRGPCVESVHRGALAVATATGDLVLSLGDIARPIFPRSAVKALQALSLIESGAADRFGYGDSELALACASHSGTERHVAVVEGMLTKAGLDSAALACGVHWPADEEAARRLARAGARPNALHNNCSGKHAGMLATAVHSGEAVEGYWRPDHPVQLRIRHTLEGLLGRELGPDVAGIDGCSAPNWAIPLTDLARAFAQFGVGEGAAAAHREAGQRLMTACWAEPDLVAGRGRLDTEVMCRLPNEVFLKVGAEGAYCAALPLLGVGVALKIEDGGKRAAEALIMHLLGCLVPKADRLVTHGVLENVRGLAIGEIRPAEEFRTALATLGLRSL